MEVKEIFAGDTGEYKQLKHKIKNMILQSDGCFVGADKVYDEVVKPLIEECSKLAAYTCCVDGGLVGDDHGHTYCTMYKKLSLVEKAYDDGFKAFKLVQERVNCLETRLKGAGKRALMVQESKEKILGHYNAAALKKNKAIGMLSSMVSSGEQHSKNSLELTQVALDS